MKIASITPVTNAPPRSPPSASGPSTTPINTGASTAITPGRSISFNAACVEIATQDL